MADKNFIEENIPEILALIWLKNQTFNIPPTPEKIHQMYYYARDKIIEDRQRKGYTD